MIYLAPLVSQAQMGSHHVGMTNMQDSELVICGLPSEQTPKHSGVHVHELEAACGYCALLFHLNWLDVQEFKLPKLVAQNYERVTAQTLRSKSAPINCSVNPRAPPRYTPSFT